MGCTPSKSHRVRTKTPNANSYDADAVLDGSLIINSERHEDELRIANLKRDFEEDLEMFVLNNLLMSVMFFDNYEREMQKVANTTSRKEQEMSLKLMKDHKKQCIMPDVVFENVNHMVRFKRKHGPKKHIEEPLIPQRMFITHDTIEVLKETEDLNHYSGIDKPTHRANIEPSNNPGFVKLRHVEYLNPEGLKERLSFDSSNWEDSTSYLNGKELLRHGNREIQSTYADSKPSTSNSSETDSVEYDYTTINESRTQRPLSIVNMSRNYSGGLPPNCIQEVKIKNIKYGTDDDDDEEKDELYLTRHYIASNEFMAYFREVFPGTLGEALGFSSEEIKCSTFNTGAIFCDASDEYGRLVNCEVIPAVLNPWPDLDEWAKRSRNTVIDRKTTMRYKWPSDKMVSEIVKLHSVVIPRGFLQKRGDSLDTNHEWEIGFLKAEKFMHTRMSHAQMRCFLFLTALHKTFIEPLTAKQGVQIEHLRTLMFWQCEANFRQWYEEKLGTKLIKVLGSFYNSLAKKNLSDYFISDRNLFENIPGGFLRIAQEKIHNITETPVVHFLCALRNLRYSSDRFYPSLNCDELYSMLYSTTPMIYLNPHLQKQVEMDKEQTKHTKRLNPEQLWEKRKLEQTRRQQEKLKEQEREREASNLINQPRLSTDSIDFRWSVKKNFDPLKAAVIIPFFIEHFIKIAEVSMKYSNQNQALFYLKQSWYLTKVHEGLPSGAIKGQELQSRIKVAEDLCRHSKQRHSFLETSTPHIPARNSTQIPKEMQLKTKTMDIKKLSQSWNGINVDTSPSVPQSTGKSSGNWAEVNVANSGQATRRTTKTAKFNAVVDYSDI